MNVKHSIKAMLARLIGMGIQLRGNRVVVLCYHSVHPHKRFSITPELFEQHIKWLRSNCQFVPFSQVLQAFQNMERDKPLVAITFDDGYADNYEFAFPLLRKYGIPATFFVTVGLVEQEPGVLERFQRLRNASLEDIRPLTWEQLREMRHEGMDIGAHTWSHPNLARLSPEKCLEELRGAKEVLEDRLGEAVTLLAYPFGKPGRHFTLETMEVAARVGYEMAAATTFRAVKPSDSPLAIPRFFVTGDDIETLAAKVMGGWDWLGWWHEWAPLWLAKRISPEDFRV